MATKKSKLWLWIVLGILGILIIVGIIWAVSSSGTEEERAGQEALDDEDLQETADDIKDNTMSQQMKDCRKACRIICKANHKAVFGGRGRCKRKCKSDCNAGIDVLANRSNY